MYQQADSEKLFKWACEIRILIKKIIDFCKKIKESSRFFVDFKMESTNLKIILVKVCKPSRVDSNIRKVAINFAQFGLKYKKKLKFL